MTIGRLAKTKIFETKFLGNLWHLLDTYRINDQLYDSI